MQKNNDQEAIKVFPPPTAVVMADDGSLLIEWTNGQRRHGISLEKKPSDSGWYFVSLDPKGIGTLAESGTMANLDLPNLLRKLVK